MSKRDAFDRNRLAKLLGMMGSEHDGEVINAARQADKLVKTASLTWRDVVSPAADVKLVEVRVAYTPTERELIEEILAAHEPLDQRESTFLRDMLRRTRFTPGQTRWIKMIAVKVGVL